MVTISSLRDIIGTTLCVSVTYDQHIILTGKLQAIDAQGNLLLDNVKEITTGNSSNISSDGAEGADSGSDSNSESESGKIRILHQRILGLVSVPRDSIVSVKMDKTLFRKRQIQKSDLIDDVI